MLNEFTYVLKENDLLDPTKKILLAVSGGVDSIVLLHLMNQLPQAKRPQLHIAHLNHQLREESDDEETFVKNLATSYDIPFYLHKWKKENQPATGIEEAARIERYSFFRKTMKAQKIDYLMTGHHQDDQVETVLMRLTRGASLEQLTGIQKQQAFKLEDTAGYLVRPLLPFSKEEIYAYADIEGLAYVEDESNQSMDYTRNRFRNEIIPLLKEENEQFNEHIEQFTDDISDLLEVAEEPINKAYKEIVHEQADTLQLNLEKFSIYPQAMQKFIITKLLENLYHGKEVSYKTTYIELLRDWLLEGEVNTTLDLTDSFVAKKTYTKAIFKKKATQKADELSKDVSFTLDTVNQWLKLSDTESIGLFVKGENEEPATDELLITENHLHLPLTIRHRQPGDRMTYKGLAGRKKLKDIFIDAKTPPKERDQAWIVEDNQGTILWLLAHRKMDLFTGQETDKLVYVLKYVKK